MSIICVLKKDKLHHIKRNIYFFYGKLKYVSFCPNKVPDCDLHDWQVTVILADVTGARELGLVVGSLPG